MDQNLTSYSSSSIATELPFYTTSNLPVRTCSPVPCLQQYSVNVPTYAPLSSQLQSFDGTDYRYRPKQFVVGINFQTVYQFGSRPTSPDQKHFEHVRRLALVTIFLDGLASSWSNSLSEADT